MNEINFERKSEDYIVRATAAHEEIRAFAMISTNTTEEARIRHNTYPTVTAALGRLMTGGAMMGVMMKGDDDQLTLQIRSEGPLRGMTVTADAHGNVRGYPIVPNVDLPPSPQHKLDVGRAVGPGRLTVIKDLGLKDPYVSTVNLQTGEIGDDLTYYFASSEQIPSAVGLGVLMNTNNTVRVSGGFIVQLMPQASEETVEQLEQAVAAVSSVTAILDEQKTPENLLRQILGGMDLEITDRLPARFYCSCSKDRVESALYSLAREELKSMIDDGEEIEVKCNFCNTPYHFSVDRLQEIYDRRK